MLMSRYGRPDHRRGDYADGRRDYGYDYAKRDMHYSGESHYEPYPDMARRDYEHGRQYRDHREYDMRSRDYDDYAQTEYGKMSDKDLMYWGDSLLNSDGTKGEHFKHEQIEHLAKQLGIDMHKFGGIDVFTMAVNMIYADYCSVAKKFNVDRPEFYAEFAKAFLDDKDFHGKGEEKLWLYYKCIAEQE